MKGRFEFEIEEKYRNERWIGYYIPCIRSNFSIKVEDEDKVQQRASNMVEASISFWTKYNESQAS